MIIVCSNCDSGFKVPNGAISPEGRFVKCSVCDHEWVAKPQDIIAETEEQPKPAPIPEPELITKAPEPAPVKAEEAKAPEPVAPIEKPIAAEKPLAAEPTKTSETKQPLNTTGTQKRFVAPPTPIYNIPAIYYTAMGFCAGMMILLVLSVLVYKRDTLVASFPSLEPLYAAVHMTDNSNLKLEMVDCTIRQVESSQNNNKIIEVEVDVVIQNNSDAERRLDAIRFTIYDIERNYLGELIMDAHQIIKPTEQHRIEGRLNRVPSDSYYVAIDIGNEVDLYVRNINNIHKFG